VWFIQKIYRREEMNKNEALKMFLSSVALSVLTIDFIGGHEVQGINPGQPKSESREARLKKVIGANTTLSSEGISKLQEEVDLLVQNGIFKGVKPGLRKRVWDTETMKKIVVGMPLTDLQALLTELIGGEDEARRIVEQIQRAQTQKINNGMIDWREDDDAFREHTNDG
jgi:hypothetical protein